MHKFSASFLIAFLLAACGADEQPVSTGQQSYTIDTGRISVSGVSAGGYMAGQLHIAHSALFNGAAVIAAGPYYCAMGDLNRGLGPCMKGGEIDNQALLGYAQAMTAAGKIDDLANLGDDVVWLFHGSLDTIVSQEPLDHAAEFYIELTAEGAVTLRNDVAAVHGIPSLATGPACDEFAAPYINACDFDAAGELLAALHGSLNARGTPGGTLESIEQPGATDAEMLSEAFLYVPTACAAGEACGIHVALHGCLQSSAYVDDAFARGAGYNEWAETNNLLVLYPQVDSSKFAPLNPNGCWDWWGYTGEDYATRDGVQIRVIKATLDALAGTTL